MTFLIAKTAFMLALVAFAIREYIVAGRPDSNPEFTRKLLHTFSAAERARGKRPAPAAEPPRPATEPALPANDPEAPRRAA